MSINLTEKEKIEVMKKRIATQRSVSVASGSGGGPGGGSSGGVHAAFTEWVIDVDKIAELLIELGAMGLPNNDEPEAK